MPDRSKIMELVEISKILSEKGFGTSTSGNCSIRDSNYVYMTPTGISLGKVNENNVSVTDISGNYISGGQPTKEKGLHLSIYSRLQDAGCILHVHPVHSIALSIRMRGKGICFSPSATPQFVMRCKRVPLIPYAHPGSRELIGYMEDTDLDKAVIMTCHGVVTFGKTAELALNTLEELEENSRIILLAGLDSSMLTDKDIDELLERKM